MKEQSIPSLMAVAAALMMHGSWCVAAETSAGDKTTSVDLVCFAEQPAILEGESTILRAWATTADGKAVNAPLSFEWRVDAGQVDSRAASTRWDLSTEATDPQVGVRSVNATVRVSAADGEVPPCNVQVFIGKRDLDVPTRGTLAVESLLSARHYLLPGKPEEPGFGLYSYLLFAAPPKDAIETERYRKTIEGYLLVLQDVDDYLKRHVRPKGLNIAYIPLKHMPKPGASNAESAVNVLAAYDYAGAQMLLSRVQQSHPDGPYLLSVLSPLSEPGMHPHLWQDLTGVAPELTWDWIKFFTYLAAQERSWSDDSLRRFGLRLRNLIAVGGQVTSVTIEGLGKAIRFESGS